MSLKTILTGAVACAFMASPAFAQAGAAPAGSPPPPPKHHHHHAAMTTGSDRLDLLERRVEEQAQEIHDLRAQMAGGTAAPGPQGPVSAADFAALQNQVYETQAAVKAAATPHDKKVHMKGITVTFGGFAAAESVYRSNNEESDIGSSYSKIPFPGPGTTGTGSGSAVSTGHMGEFRMSARQSRVSGLVQGDVDPNTHLAFYGEFDFLGAAASANSNESNSFTPRVRNLYGTVDWSDIGVKLLFGQSWSLATLDGSGISERSELAPPTIDAQYVPGFDWTRQPQIRLVKDFGDQVWLGVSVENPQTTIGGTAPNNLVDLTVNNGSSFSTAGANGTADAEFNPGITLSINHIPDIIGKIAVEPAFFDGNVHLEAFGIYRDFYDRYGYVEATTAAELASVGNHDTSGGGVGFGALIKVIPGWLDLQASGMFGNGIGRYGSGQLSDVTYNANGNLKPLSENMEMLGLTVHATHELDLYAFGGREHENASYFNTAGAGGYGNPTVANAYDACASFTLSGSCSAGSNLQDVEQITAGLWDNAYDGDYGKLRIGLQYSYTYLKALPGQIQATGTPVLGQPHTNDNMVFTSFRYYPF